MEIKSEWTMPVVTRHKNVEYPFNPGQIKEVPNDFDMKKVRNFKVVKKGTMEKYKEEKSNYDPELDFNKDGKNDGQDASLGAKAMAKQRHKGDKK